MSDTHIDVCALDPPEPMERVLDALSTLNQNGRLAVLIDREPHPLYRILDRNGYRHSIELRDDHRYNLYIWSDA